MKRFFYSLKYVYTDSNNDRHCFFIGYFSTINKLKEAVKSIKTKPGFKDFCGAFEIVKFAVTFDSNIQEKSGIVLYEVSHEYFDNDGYDNVTIFGVYSTPEKAREVQLQNSAKHPYNEFPAGFCIAECKVDLIGWSEGFSSW